MQILLWGDCVLVAMLIRDKGLCAHESVIGRARHHLLARFLPGLGIRDAGTRVWVAGAPPLGLSGPLTLGMCAFTMAARS